MYYNKADIRIRNIQQFSNDMKDIFSISIVDELRKLAELRSEEILTEQEFVEIKQQLIKKVSRS